MLRPATHSDHPLNTVGQQSGVSGFLLAGGSSGDDAGYSIARGGNVAGRGSIGGGTPSDLLIGAPDRTPGGIVNGTGSAFLVYANTAANLQNLTTVSGNLLSSRCLRSASVFLAHSLKARPWATLLASP